MGFFWKEAIKELIGVINGFCAMVSIQEFPFQTVHSDVNTLSNRYGKVAILVVHLIT